MTRIIERSDLFVIADGEAGMSELNGCNTASNLNLSSGITRTTHNEPVTDAGYEFEKCHRSGCTEDATFLAFLEGVLVAYCEAHGVEAGLTRGIPRC